jgi:hypothetical protein
MLTEAPRIGEPELAQTPGMSGPLPNPPPRSALEGLGAETLITLPDTSGPGPYAPPVPGAWTYDVDPATGISRASFNGEVSPGAASVVSFNGRTGAVTLVPADLAGAGGPFLPLAGGTVTGDLTLSETGANLWIRSAPGNGNQIIGGRQGTGTAGIRWIITPGDATAESGAATGSDFSIGRFDNTGNFLGPVAFRIARADAQVTLAGPNPVLNINPSAGANATIYLNKPSGTTSVANYIGGNTNGVSRWLMGLGDAGSESGTNNGSDFLIYSYSDTGANLYAPITIKRSTGVVTFQFPIVNGSDRALKKNIAPIKDALAKVLKLQGVAFERIGSEDREIGLIAQDVLGAVPEVVRETSYTLPEDAPADLRRVYSKPVLGIAYAQLTALLIEAVKQLSQRVETLEGSR